MKKIISVLVLIVCTFSFTFVGCSPTTYNFNFIINLNGVDASNYDSSDYLSLPIDLTDIAERYYGEDYLKSQEVYEKFKAYAEGLSKHLNYSNDVTTAYPDKEYGFQLEEPAVGEEIAIMHTNMGDIYMRFFPEGAPKAVENFKALAKSGYYNGLEFFRVVEDGYIQSGDPANDGTGGMSATGAKFNDEFDKKLLNLRGAVSMANRGPNTNESQFFINQNKPAITDDSKKIFDIVQIYITYIDAYEHNIEFYKSYGKDYLELYPTFEKYIEDHLVGFSPVSYLVPDEVWKLYDEKGGNIHLDGAWRSSGGNTVFAQVFKGMDTVDTIAKTAINGDTGKPEIDLIINRIELVPYTK